MNCGLYQQASFRQAAGPEFRPGGLLLTEELAAACDVKAGEHVLDVACGVGSTVSYLSRTRNVQACGLDASPGFLREAGDRDPRPEWMLGKAEALPFPDASFDVVFAECFLSTAEKPAAVLAEVGRVLRPGGRLALSDMYLRAPEHGPLSLVSRATCLRGAVGIGETLGTLKRCGFSVRRWWDRSDALGTLMASLILAYGSAADFWSAAADVGEGLSRGALAQIRAARPGYYLLVAEVLRETAATVPSPD